jgi:hypothetical protein
MDQFMAMQNFLLLRKVFSRFSVAIFAPCAHFSQLFDVFLAYLLLFGALPTLIRVVPYILSCKWTLPSKTATMTASWTARSGAAS